MMGRYSTSSGALYALVTIVACLAMSVSALAHHSHANYDQTVFTILEGRVEEIRWSNPHTWIYLEVQDGAGDSSLWVLESGSPAHLESQGWAREDIAVGDTIRVRCHQLKDGENGCLTRFLTAREGPEKPFD